MDLEITPALADLLLAAPSEDSARPAWLEEVRPHVSSPAAATTALHFLLANPEGYRGAPAAGLLVDQGASLTEEFQQDLVRRLRRPLQRHPKSGLEVMPDLTVPLPREAFSVMLRAVGDQPENEVFRKALREFVALREVARAAARAPGGNWHAPCQGLVPLPAPHSNLQRTTIAKALAPHVPGFAETLRAAFVARGERYWPELPTGEGATAALLAALDQVGPGEEFIGDEVAPLAQKLLEKGADPRAFLIGRFQPRSALELAITREAPAAARALMEHGATLDERCIEAVRELVRKLQMSNRSLQPAQKQLLLELLRDPCPAWDAPSTDWGELMRKKSGEVLEKRALPQLVERVLPGFAVAFAASRQRAILDAVVPAANSPRVRI